MYSEKIDVKFEKMSDNATLPTQGQGDAGIDFYASQDIVIPPKTIGVVRTEIKMQLPEGYWMQLSSRSGMTVKKAVTTEAGVIDNGYRGEILVALYNTRTDVKLEIKKGDKITQGVLHRNIGANISEVDSVDTDTERGDGKFGSTGM